jgi:hypothetical protein
MPTVTVTSSVLGPKGTGPSSAPATEPGGSTSECVDRSARSQTILLVETAERVRTDPAGNFGDSAVRGASRVLADRLVWRLGEPSRRHRALRHLRELRWRRRSVGRRPKRDAEGVLR